ncbi:helix-turn-helix domain-containing protein [soil metagenome]
MTAPGHDDGSGSATGHWPRREIDASSLHGLAHPLRITLLDALSLHGEATASMLATRLGESSGATSYHLRQLARHGFVEECPELGTGRERWWRMIPGGIAMAGTELLASPATSEAATLVLNEFGRAKQARRDHWQRTIFDWDEPWQQASMDTTARVRLTSEEAMELQHQIDELLEQWVERTRSRTPRNAFTNVEVQVDMFPLGTPPRDRGAAEVSTDGGGAAEASASDEAGAARDRSAAEIEPA